MKFSLKIVLGTMLIVVIMFSLSGIIIIHKNFKNSYQLMMKTNLDEHKLDKYNIESNINENILTNGEFNITELEKYFYNLTSYLGNRKKLAIFINNKSVWNNIPFDINEQCKETCIKEYDSNKYSILKSNLHINDQNILIISAYDISGVFSVRNQNLLNFYIIDTFLLLICGCFTTLFARLLTKSIKQLNENTKLVIEKNIDIKIAMKGNDEISELSKSFAWVIDTLKTRQKELELSLKQREDFISNFTHELKTPMTSIMGYTKILKQDKYTKKDKEKALNYIYSETKRLEILSHKLLDLIGLSKDKIILSKINTKEFFEEIKDLANNRFPNISLNLDIKKETIIIDKELIITCIMNLVENAYKASDKDKKIKIIGQTILNKYKVSIIDNGIGIEKDEINRITEDFYMVDNSRSKKKDSYGLGLGLCTKILKFHNTKLNFESKKGKYTKVSFDLEVSSYE